MAREEERSRIARDLHDEALQDLAAMAQAQLARQATTGENGLSERLERLSEALKRVEQRVRGAIYDLSLDGERDRSFAEVLRDLVELHRSTAPQTETRLEVADGLLAGPLGDTGRELLRLIGEALTNARRHSGAREIQVAVWSSAGRLYAEVSDDGRGFDPGRGRLPPPPEGWGFGGCARGRRPSGRRSRSRASRRWALRYASRWP